MSKHALRLGGAIFDFKVKPDEVATCSASSASTACILPRLSWITIDKEPNRNFTADDGAESIEYLMPSIIPRGGDGVGRGPSVLQRLCKRDFFGPCKAHSHLKNGFLNYFVLDEHHERERACCRHSDLLQGAGGASKLIQVRRYMHRNVVLVEDMQMHYDTRGIRMYYINQKRAILLQPKEPSTSNSVYDNRCRSCKVSLHPDCMFCSLACSIDAPDHIRSVRIGGSSKKGKGTHLGGAGQATGVVKPPPKARSLRSRRRAWSRKPEHPLRSPE
jgi:hypothetical protein